MITRILSKPRVSIAQVLFLCMGLGLIDLIAQNGIQKTMLYHVVKSVTKLKEIGGQVQKQNAPSKPFLILDELGLMEITSYRSIKSQTDSSPNFTSIGDFTHKGGCAVSRDLLARWKGPLNYGDYLYIDGLGIYQINDCMGDTTYDKETHKRYKIRQHIDIWVSSRDEEKKIGVQFHKVFMIKRHIQE